LRQPQRARFRGVDHGECGGIHRGVRRIAVINNLLITYFFKKIKIYFNQYFEKFTHFYSTLYGTVRLAAHHHGPQRHRLHSHEWHEHDVNERRVFWAALLTAGFMVIEATGGMLTP
jgi:hypothetical protein